ncbi:carboxylesterase family protein [Streptomyces sp. NPDC059398]|uniref:carboxylesterase family protein n=1 Tax=Streptomyces sp. NPDC059398 TaxID=3346820 RepID=UPI0036AA8718
MTGSSTGSTGTGPTGTGTSGTGPAGAEPVRTGPIRYATAERFGRPRAVAARDARPAGGEICPQPPSRLDAVMGPPHDRRPQGEDCLNLTVTAPAGGGGARPVMVWFHGGGFSSGAGLMDWYDGGALAAQGDVVVVGVNYRVGALGYLCLDGVSEGNLGLYDQLEALRWVREHIAEYGGDPGSVTVFGQSAGGISIRLLMEMAEARGLFHRAILQSAPLVLTERSREDAEALGRIFADHLATLGESPSTAGPAALLDAQRVTAAAHLREAASSLEPPFSPVEGVIGRDGAAFAANVRGLDVLYGWNADDMTAFPGETGDPAELTARMYAAPLAELGARLERAGARVHSYRLDWRPAGSPLGATHCVELPLLLGGRGAWEGAPMLGDTPWDEVEALGAALRTTWLGFVRTGVPGAAPEPLHCAEGPAPVPVPGRSDMV